MNEVKLTGKYLGATEIKEVGANGTKVRQFWLDVSENAMYPNTPELQLMGDKCALVENLKPGTEIEVLANLKGRKVAMPDGKERVFTNVDAWRINIVQRTSAAFAPTTSTPPQSSFQNTTAAVAEDKLPF